MSQPEYPPRFFLDRSLGRKAVPEALRADGWDLITLAEHYGMPADERGRRHRMDRQRNVHDQSAAGQSS